MNSKKHYFIALPLPNTMKAIVSSYMDNLKTNLPFQRWVHPEDLHITLAFLGYAEEEQLHKVNEKMRIIAANYDALSLTLTSLNTFGNKQNPRILWYGVEENDEMNNLRADVYSACEEVGFSLDKRPFHPHITLARKWEGKRFSNDVMTTHHTMKDSFQVSEFVLYQTNLHSVPKYEIINLYKLIEE